MKFTETKLAGSYLIELDHLSDDRGDFARSYCAREFADRGLHSRFVQHNISRNTLQRTTRGLHYQKHPFQEVKVVQCIRGSVFDVIVDLRVESPTRGQWLGVQLQSAQHQLLYIPKGFAHGFQTLEEQSELLYLMGEYYVDGQEAGVRWDDPELAIDWPFLNDIIVSGRDKELPLLKEINWIEEDAL